MIATACPPTAEAAFCAAVERRERDGPGALTDTWIDECCAGDRAVVAELKSLLRHLDAADRDSAESGGFLDPNELHGSRAGPLRDDAELRAWGGATTGQRVGEFTIVGQLGAGGMGVVYVAEQQRPRRTVALKLIRRALATPPVVARFEREADLLGRLGHPGIAQIFAAGVADVRPHGDGGGPALRIPYIAMERVEGLEIREFVRARRCSRDEIVALLVQTCDAIEHAHQRGVIHRDLKPANLLVAVGERGAPRVKVLDFGVARAVGGSPGDESLTRLTDHGHLIGTPAYMSPEQIAGRGHEVTAAADVYAIGAILFELLAGRQAIDVDGCALPEVARRVVDHVPPRLGTIDRRFRGDLEAIVARTLAKDPRDRYASPLALGNDLQRVLEGRPIDAPRPPGAILGPCVALLARQRATVAIAVAIVTLLAGAVGIALHESAQRRVAEAKARAAIDALVESRIELARARLATGDRGGAAAIVWAEIAREPQSPVARRGLAELLAGPRRRETIDSRDGRHTASCDDAGTVDLNVTDGTHLRRLLHVAGHATKVGFSPNGTMLAAREADGAVRLWNTEDGRPIALP